MSKPIYGSPLLDRVAQLVRERPRTVLLDDLASEVGVTRQWITGLAYGRAKGPNAVKVEKLYVILTGKQLIND